MRRRTVATCASLAAALLASPACTHSDPAEVVVRAAEAPDDSHGAFEISSHLEFYIDSGTEGEEVPTPPPILTVGAWDGEDVWLDQSGWYEGVLAQQEELQEDMGIEMPLESFPQPMGTLVRGERTLTEYRVDGERRWFEGGAYDWIAPDTDEESSEEAASEEEDWFTLFMSPGAASPSRLLEAIEKAAEDPSTIEESPKGDYTVALPLEASGAHQEEEGEVAPLLGIDPEEVVGFSEDPEAITERLRRLEEWAEEHSRHHATVSLDSEGRLETLVMELGMSAEDHPHCEPLTSQAMEIRTEITYTYTEEPPEMPDPSEEEIGGAAELEALWGPAREAALVDTTFETVAGERYRNEILRYLIDWATEAGIDWTQVPPLDDTALVETFNTFFTQKAEEEGGAIATADGLWLPSDIRQVLVEDGAATSDEVDGLSREELASRFDRLWEESGGRGSLGPGTAGVPDVYSLREDGLDVSEWEGKGLEDAEDEGAEVLGGDAVEDDYDTEEYVSLEGCPV